MEDSKAMPHPPSPHSPPHADPSDSLVTLPSSKDDCASVPLYTPTPLPLSPRLSVSASSMATSLQDIAPSSFKGLQSTTYEGLDDTDNNMQWGTQDNPLIPQMGQEDSGFHLPMHFNPGTTAAYNYDRTAFNDNYNLSYQSHLPSSCPRSLNSDFGLTGLPSGGMNASSYPPPMYQMGPQQPYEGMDLSQSPNHNLMQLDAEYDEYPLRPMPEDATAYSSPYDSDLSRASTPNGASPCTLHEEGPVDGDQPYAQLIYRALRDAPNHTMILRDIYDWFRKHTSKAADKDTKGWQNSIRHNLSMNGAFEKVDQPCEESRKGFMWRLTQEALENGVKSTTRYRSKHPNKRGHRTGLYPQRQRAGAIGGRNAKKQLRHKTRMNDAYRSEPYQSRSVPTPTTFDSPFNSEMSMYSRSPFYSPSGSEPDHMEYQVENYSNPLRSDMMQQSFPTHGLPMLASPLGNYGGFSDGHIQLSSDPAEPLFTNSPSPSTSEPQPRTPDSDVSPWSENFFSHMGGGVGLDPFVTIGDSTHAHEPLGETE